MPLPRAQSYPQTQEYARARTFRQLALVVAFTVLVVVLVALSALAGFINAALFAPAVRVARCYKARFPYYAGPI